MPRRGRRIKTKFRRHRPNSAAPVRALTAHLFRSLTPDLTSKQLRHFLEHCLPHVPGAADLCKSIGTLRDWVHKYDDDAFDATLSGMGITKVVWPADFDDADERVNKLVVEKLGNLAREQLANANSLVAGRPDHHMKESVGEVPVEEDVTIMVDQMSNSNATSSSPANTSMRNNDNHDVLSNAPPSNMPPSAASACTPSTAPVTNYYVIGHRSGWI